MDQTTQIILIMAVSVALAYGVQKYYFEAQEEKNRTQKIMNDIFEKIQEDLRKLRS